MKALISIIFLLWTRKLDAQDLGQEKSMLVMNMCQDQNLGPLTVFSLGFQGEGVLVEEEGVFERRNDKMVCVGSMIPCGHQLEITVARNGEQFSFHRFIQCRVRQVYPLEQSYTQWRYNQIDKRKTPRVIVVDHYVQGVWPGEEVEVMSQGFIDGVRLLFYNCGKPDLEQATSHLAISAAVGEATSGALLILFRSAYYFQQNQTLEQKSVLVEELRRYAPSWLASLALGKNTIENCDDAAQHYVELLKQIARPGIASSARARIKTKHFIAAPNELLIDHWLRADGYDLLRALYIDEMTDDNMFHFDNDRTPFESFQIGNLLLRRGNAREAGQYFSLAATEIPEARAALAELYLGELEYNLSRAMEFLHGINAGAHGMQIKAHILADIEQKYDQAIEMWLKAIAAGSVDAKVSLGLFLLRSEKNETKQALHFLTSAFENDGSLTAALALAQFLLRRNKCDRALSILKASAQHSWDLDIGDFGMTFAKRQAAALWEIKDKRNNILDKLNNFFSKFVQSNHNCQPKERAIDSYWMFAVLAEAGIVAADINAGFIAQRLGWNKTATRHYRRVAQAAQTARPIRNAPLFLRARLLEIAEALRSLADLTQDKNLNTLAASLGSEWALFNAALNETHPSKAIRIARRCARFFDWPQSVPCAFLFFWLKLKSILFSFSTTSDDRALFLFSSPFSSAVKEENEDIVQRRASRGEEF